MSENAIVDQCPPAINLLDGFRYSLGDMLTHIGYLGQDQEEMPKLIVIARLLDQRAEATIYGYEVRILNTDKAGHICDARQIHQSELVPHPCANGVRRPAMPPMFEGDPVSMLRDNMAQAGMRPPQNSAEADLTKTAQ